LIRNLGIVNRLISETKKRKNTEFSTKNEKLQKYKGNHADHEEKK